MKIIRFKEYSINEEFNIDNIKSENKELEEFIGESVGYITYLHTTNSEEKAKSICQNGFRYYDFNKTTDYIYNSESLNYMLMIRKLYGNYTIIIQIKNTIKDYDSLCKVEIGEDNEELFTLPPQYIKGYYNRFTKEIVKNPLFKY